MNAKAMAERILAAVAQAGSAAFNHHAGATLELMSDLAKAGELEAMCRALLSHAAAHPGDRLALVQAVPAKILNQYIYIKRERSVRAVERWRERTPGWAETLERACVDPARLASVASGMADDVGRAEVE